VRTVYQRKSVIRQKLGMEEKGDIVEFLSWLYRTKERHQKRYTEIHYKAVKDGDDDILLPCTLRNDGQGSVHRSGTTWWDGSKITEPTDHQWGAQQSHDFAGYVR
jgi:hypothetical protein